MEGVQFTDRVGRITALASLEFQYAEFYVHPFLSFLFFVVCPLILGSFLDPVDFPPLTTR